MKIPVDSRVAVSGTSNQWPYERISDTGTVIARDNRKRPYLVALDKGRENLLFFRRDLTEIV